MNVIERKRYCVFGEWRESSTQQWLDVTDASTGQVIAQVPACTKAEVEQAIESAGGVCGLSALSLASAPQMLFPGAVLSAMEELTHLCARAGPKLERSARRCAKGH